MVLFQKSKVLVYNSLIITHLRYGILGRSYLNVLFYILVESVSSVFSSLDYKKIGLTVTLE